MPPASHPNNPTPRPNRRRTRSALFAVLTAGMTLVAGQRVASAFSWFTYDGWIVVWPTATDTRWLSTSTFQPGSPIEQAALAAMGAWNVAGGSSWQYTVGYGELYPPDQLDGYSYTEAVPASYLDGDGTLAVTFLGNIDSQWVDMDTLFNANAPNGWLWNAETAPDLDVLTDPETYGFVFMQVAMHEFGHSFGLGHEDELLCNLNSFYPNGGTTGQENVIEPHADDRAGMRFLYPGGLPYTDLANANFYRTLAGSSAPIFFQPTAIDPGQELTVRVVIENLGTTTQFNVSQGLYLSNDEFIDTSDTFLGAIVWESLAAGGSGEFDLLTDLPDELASGTYYLGTILDDDNSVTEQWEDNNTTRYHAPLVINFLTPVIQGIADQSAVCGQPFTGPTPQPTRPQNMNPLTWTLVSGPAGMTIDKSTGVVHWTNSRVGASGFLITLRAANAVGAGERSFLLTVPPAAPQLSTIPDVTAGCGQSFDGPTPQVQNAACAGTVFPWTLQQAPAGMTIDPATGVVSWPTAVASDDPYPVTVRAFNASGSDTASFQLLVSPADVNGDAATTFSDFQAFAVCHFAAITDPVTVCPCADQDGDGVLDLLDFARLQSRLDTPAAP